MHLFSPYKHLFLNGSKPHFSSLLGEVYAPILGFVILLHDICYGYTATHSINYGL